MKKTRLTDLNDHLFLALEQVNAESDEDGNPLSEEAVRQRIAKASAVSKLGAQIIAVGRLALDAEALRSEMVPGRNPPKLLGLDGD